MSYIKCMNGQAKGFEANIDGELKIGDTVSIPVDSLCHSNGQKYVHYSIKGFVGEKYLLFEANMESETASNEG